MFFLYTRIRKFRFNSPLFLASGSLLHSQPSKHQIGLDAFTSVPTVCVSVSLSIFCLRWNFLCTISFNRLVIFFFFLLHSPPRKYVWTYFAQPQIEIEQNVAHKNQRFCRFIYFESIHKLWITCEIQHVTIFQLIYVKRSKRVSQSVIVTASTYSITEWIKPRMTCVHSIWNLFITVEMDHWHYFSAICHSQLAVIQCLERIATYMAKCVMKVAPPFGEYLLSIWSKYLLQCNCTLISHVRCCSSTVVCFSSFNRSNKYHKLHELNECTVYRFECIVYAHNQLSLLSNSIFWAQHKHAAMLSIKRSTENMYTSIRLPKWPKQHNAILWHQLCAWNTFSSYSLFAH